MADEDDVMDLLLPDLDEDDRVAVDGVGSSIDGVLHHRLRSVDATLVIRQLPSQGLSFQLWPAAASLVSLLDSGPSSLFPASAAGNPLRVLELGSGTGLVGIAAAALLGARATLTDLPHVLPNLRFNAAANAAAVAARGGSVDVRQLVWGEDDADVSEEEEEYDVVLASDVVYYDHLFDPLLRTLRRFVRADVGFVMAHLRRWKKRDAAFFRKARRLFAVDTVHTDAPLAGCRTGVAVYRFTAKEPKPKPI